MKESELKIVLILNCITVILYSLAISLHLNTRGNYIFTSCLIIGEIFTIFAVLRKKK